MPGRTGVVVVDITNEESDNSEVGKGSGEVGRGVAEGLREPGVRRGFLWGAGNCTKGPGSGLFLVERRDARTTEEQIYARQVKYMRQNFCDSSRTKQKLVEYELATKCGMS